MCFNRWACPWRRYRTREENSWSIQWVPHELQQDFTLPPWVKSQLLGCSKLSAACSGLWQHYCGRKIHGKAVELQGSWAVIILALVWAPQLIQLNNTANPLGFFAVFLAVSRVYLILEAWVALGVSLGLPHSSRVLALSLSLAQELSFKGLVILFWAIPFSLFQFAFACFLITPWSCFTLV